MSITKVCKNKSIHHFLILKEVYFTMFKSPFRLKKSQKNRSFDF